MDLMLQMLCWHLLLYELHKKGSKLPVHKHSDGIERWSRSVSRPRSANVCEEKSMHLCWCSLCANLYCALTMATFRDWSHACCLIWKFLQSVTIETPNLLLLIYISSIFITLTFVSHSYCVACFSPCPSSMTTTSTITSPTFPSSNFSS